MTLLIYAFAIVFVVILAAGWLTLIFSVVLTAASTAVGLPVFAGGMIRHRLGRPVARSVEEGILCLEGLAEEAQLAKRLRAGIARVLAFASPETHPRACACIRHDGAGYVGVMRIFNAKGHYLLRATGRTAAAIAKQFVTELEAFTDTFPARIGARRINCAECDMRICPLRLLKRRRVQSTPA